MNEGLVEPRGAGRVAGAVSEEVRRIGRLVDDLLDLTRLEAHQFRLVREEVGLEALLDQARQLVPRPRPRQRRQLRRAHRRRAHDRCRTATACCRSSPTCSTTPSAGRPASGTVTLSYSAVNGNAAIHISDTGPGIPAADQDAVFHPFYSRRGEGGTGLGLSIGRELAHALGRPPDGRERGRPRHDLHAVPAVADLNGPGR